jgi:flagellar biosynthesis protein FliQ|tara:strand:+ start:5862 stop:6152 length:291 start_codon:yes stop_codon:yes gene_type:complete
MIRAGAGDMNEADALDIMQAAIWTILVASGPAVLTAMIVGVGIALLQALTQVQEMTLTFVPKIVAIMVALGVTAPFIGAQINLFATLVFSRVQSGF